jgi:hypothetical protein
MELKRVHLLLAAVGVSLACASAGWWLYEISKRPLLPPATTTTTVVRSQPNVLVAVTDLARLESVSFHMERVIDLSEKQSRLFGLVQGEDAILLVAVAEISAGVDLGKMSDRDVTTSADSSRAEVHLPAPEIFHVALDNGHTYVHSRKTDLLARRQETLESRARSEAEKVLLDGAKEAGILRQAGDNARRVVEGLVRSLGYREVVVTISG